MWVIVIIMVIIQKNHNKTFVWYSKLSEKGNIQTTYYGHGTIKDGKKAFELYLKSTKVGYRLALYLIGYCYHDGSAER